MAVSRMSQSVSLGGALRLAVQEQLDSRQIREDLDVDFPRRCCPTTTDQRPNSNTSAAMDRRALIVRPSASQARLGRCIGAEAEKRLNIAAFGDGWA